jgi:hypothetical protein
VKGRASLREFAIKSRKGFGSIEAIGSSAGLLFTLRQVNQADLVANAGTFLSKTRTRPASVRVLAADDLSEMFGIDMAPPAVPRQATASVVPTKQSTAVTAAAASKQTELTRPAKSKKPAPKRGGGRRRLTLKNRQGIADRMRNYWAERTAQTRKRKAP